MFTRSKNRIDECPICLLSNFEEVGCLDCFHTFCSDCIRAWLSNNSNCPICRQQVTLVQTIFPKKRCPRFRVDHSYIRVRGRVAPELQQAEIQVEEESNSQPEEVRVPVRVPPIDWRDFFPNLREIEAFHLPAALIDNRRVSLPYSLTMNREGTGVPADEILLESGYIVTPLHYLRNIEELERVLLQHLQRLPMRYHFMQ